MTPVDFLARIAAIIEGTPQPSAPPRQDASPRPAVRIALNPWRIDWATLLLKTYSVDVRSCPCAGRLEAVELVTETERAKELLEQFGMSTRRFDGSYRMTIGWRLWITVLGMLGAWCGCKSQSSRDGSVVGATGTLAPAPSSSASATTASNTAAGKPARQAQSTLVEATSAARGAFAGARAATWAPERFAVMQPHALAVGMRDVCLRTRPGHFECAGSMLPPALDRVEQVAIHAATGYYVRGMDGQWYGFDSPLSRRMSSVDVTDGQVLDYLSGATELLLGEWSDCTLSHGVVSCWGHNGVKELGYQPQGDDCYFMNSTISCSNVPRRVPGLKKITTLAGEDSRCALDGDGVVWCWGSVFAERAEQKTVLVACTRNASCPTPPPRRVTGLPAMVEIVDTRVAFYGRDADGAVYTWGRRGSSAEEELTAESVPELVGAKRLAGDGDFRGCAILRDDTVSCWSGPRRGTLKLESVTGLGAAVALGLSSSLGCAVREDLSLWCWGNTSGLVRREGTDEASAVRVLPSAEGPAIGSGSPAAIRSSN